VWFCWDSDARIAKQHSRSGNVPLFFAPFAIFCSHLSEERRWRSSSPTATVPLHLRDPATKPAATWGDWLRYKLMNTLSAGPIAIIGWLAVVSLVVSLAEE
jgi:hypothetical protein